MSGRPEPTTIGKVRKSLIREADIVDRLCEAGKEIDRLKQEIQTLTDELGALRKSRWEMMQGMDLTSSGNYGHEQRMGVFLMELLKPVSQQG